MRSHVSLRSSLQWLLLPTRFIATTAQQQAPILQHTCEQQLKSQRVAIIGAGAGGSSAAYHLNRFASASPSGVPVDITIFDENARVGGRTTTVNAFNDSRFPVELGASIFVKVNHILYNATQALNLDTSSQYNDDTGSAYDFGVWNGETFVFTAASDDDDGSVKGRWKGWWDIAKLLWKYGLSPIRANQLMKDTIAKFLTLYDEKFPFNDLTTATETIELAGFTGSTGKEILSRNGISEEFSQDVVQASTRVNYAQNLDTIHGLETMVCLATDGAMAVEGGNWQIFDKFVQQSGATLHLESAVTSVHKTEKGKFVVKYTSTQSGDDVLQTETEDNEYDTIILAAPYQFADVTFSPPLSSPPAKVDYVSLHVTLFTSPYLPSPAFFGLESQSQVPDTVLTTLPPKHNIADGRRGKDAVGPMKFWSISTRVIDLDSDANKEKSTASSTDNTETQAHLPASGRQYLYKIFSPEPISANFLTTLFDFDLSAQSNQTATITNPSSSSSSSSSEQEFEFKPISTLPTNLITWHRLKTWNSYPYLPPRTSFSKFEIDENVWYTSAIEPFISTMETSALAGMNVARLIVDRIEEGQSENDKERCR